MLTFAINDWEAGLQCESYQKLNEYLQFNVKFVNYHVTLQNSDIWEISDIARVDENRGIEFEKAGRNFD